MGIFTVVTFIEMYVVACIYTWLTLLQNILINMQSTNIVILSCIIC